MSEWLDGLRLSLVAGSGPALRSALNVLIILAAGWAALVVVRRGIRRFRAYMEGRVRDAEEAKRVGTLCRVFRYFGSVVITIVAAMLVMNELGISIAPVLATAGVAGIAIGFGAQSLVKDYFAGFFLLLEDQIRQGDVVSVAGVGGLVEEVTLRYVRLRDFDGHVHFVPNGEIKTVTNRTRDYAQAVIEVGVAYREHVDEALAVMREVGRELRADPAWGARILDDVEIIGVERWADSAVMLRCRLKVRGIEQWNVRREFLGRLKKAYDERGIEIPFPHLTLYAGQTKDGNAPAFRVHSR
ncbi:MAG: mechanosensitive ion channel protein MscS [Betaproteobacteria bacterium RIFCSPLOWO2_02_FULL_68_150]|nr:MAG: mechanosensitive ion channel protein MscS [Betaproteobacteria bacterium RIFCSPLOWO2_02_FULL_68_150]